MYLLGLTVTNRGLSLHAHLKRNKIWLCLQRKHCFHFNFLLKFGVPILLRIFVYNNVWNLVPLLIVHEMVIVNEIGSLLLGLVCRGPLNRVWVVIAKNQKIKTMKLACFLKLAFEQMLSKNPIFKNLTSNLTHLKRSLIDLHSGLSALGTHFHCSTYRCLNFPIALNVF